MEQVQGARNIAIHHTRSEYEKWQWRALIGVTRP